MTGDRWVVVHGHFYQPPREDPWLEEIPREPGAAPFHDWNQRIERECYRAVVAARIPGPGGRIARIVNTLERISFDVGPTLLAWLEDEAPETYRAILRADRASRERNGHGNAVAAPYHHVILPLAPRRDKLTEVRWGMADFERRFGRRPEGMWLPETAVDLETLDVLAEAGLAFTILAPHQVEAPPPHGLPGTVRTPGGRSVAVLVYDGPISHDVAFGPLVRDGAAWAARLTARGDARVVSVATDGETFGHHHRFGEMALAAMLAELDARGTPTIGVAALLARHPAEHAVSLRAPSSWSCPHGVERWRADCGCRSSAEGETSQAWRAPLRRALDALAAGLHRTFEDEGGPLLGDPWAARDAYGAVVAGAEAPEAFLAARCRRDDPAARRRAAELLEMERHALGMFTSCGWFFDDIAGIEARQVLRYAARALELAGPVAAPLEAALRDTLAAAASNEPAEGTGRDVYDRAARGAVPAAARVAAGWAAAHAVGAPPDAAVPSAFAAEPAGPDGHVAVAHRRTAELARLAVAVQRPRPGALEVRVTAPDGGASWLVGPRELPERAARLVVPELVGEIGDLWFTEAESAAVCRGMPLAAVAEGALLRAVHALRDDPSPMGAAEVTDLLDLLALLGEEVPFDAQTAFHHVRTLLPAERAAELAPVGRRLGFA